LCYAPPPPHLFSLFIFPTLAFGMILVSLLFMAACSIKFRVV